MAERAEWPDLAPLLEGLDDNSAEFEPLRFFCDQAADAEALKRLLLGKGRPLFRRDDLESQVRELVRSRTPTLTDASKLDAAAREFMLERGEARYGVWVYYPWRRLLVRVLPPEEFAELRTTRNRFKITREEQARLAECTLGLVGLSAGHAIATGLALERIGTRIRLADFDSMELSNTNRVACGISVLGMNKTLVAARQLYEIDPFLSLSVFPEGITDDNLVTFLEGGGKVDLLIEECDDLEQKVRLREAARARRIPVLMETNDRGLLDVERFDLEPSRPVFHGLLGGTRAAELKGLGVAEKITHSLRIVGSEVSPRLGASLVEIGRTIAAWPQLGSGNMLGGAVTTHAARRILLGQPLSSGRYRVDLDELLDGSGRVELGREVGQPPEPAGTEAQPSVPDPPPPAARGAPPSRAEIEWLVSHAALAPSGGNQQPWRFVWRKDARLDGYLDRTRAGDLLDYACSASYLALGAAAENASIAASVLGRDASVNLFPDASEPDLVFRLKLGQASGTVTPSPLHACLAMRTTNRRPGDGRSLSADHTRRLEQAARARDAEVSLVCDAPTLSRLGGLLGAVDRFRLLNEGLYEAMMAELRWDLDSVLTTRDGIDVATLELDALGLAALRLLTDARTARFLHFLDLGSGLERPTQRLVESAAAVGLVTVNGVGPRAYAQAGRAFEHVWLVATELGLGVQPMTVAPYLFARLTRGEGEGLSPRDVEHLWTLERRFREFFPTPDGRAEAMLFRIAHAPAPRARALRRPLDDILSES